MIVKCAFCGGLPLADVENLGYLAWAKHLREHHPDWSPPDGHPAEMAPEYHLEPVLNDGEARP